jgi:hypothetical protein
MVVALSLDVGRWQFLLFVGLRKGLSALWPVVLPPVDSHCEADRGFLLWPLLLLVFLFVTEQRYPSACVVATSYDSRAELIEKYREFPAILEQLQAIALERRSSPSSPSRLGDIRVVHNVNACNIAAALGPPPSSASKSFVIADATAAAETVPAGPFDAVYFNHPHSGVEDCTRHSALLVHFFFSAEQFLAPVRCSFPVLRVRSLR